ncbi:MAG TPA: S8 family serine peptidase [Fimbriimonadales bacterium]|nr:S8 family serine peptidase [Fimbriimonadales bacterium]
MYKKLIAFILLYTISVLGFTAWAQKIYLKYAEFDPLVSVPSVSSELGARKTTPWDTWHFLVQFKGYKTPSDEAYLESIGARIDGYLPHNTLMVETTWMNSELLSKWNRVRWIGAIHPAYKISSELGTRPLFTKERKEEAKRGLHRMTVSLFDNEDFADTVNAALGLGLEVLDIGRIGPGYVIEVRGTPAQAKQLAFLDDVLFIDEADEAVYRNQVTRWVIQSNVTDWVPIWDQGVKGDGQIVGIIDGLLYKNHDVFRDLEGDPPGPDHRKIVAYYSSAGQNGGDSHGTHTSGTLAGDQEPVTGSTYRNGMAYHAKIVFTWLGDITGSNLYTKFVNAHNAGARDHSNSWGNDGTTAYTNWCKAIDQYSYEFEDGVVAFAVTNLSTLKTPENAKSCLAVGNTYQAPNQFKANTGGTGPTSDGRQKPEIWAPGTGIYSAKSGSTNGWTSMTGTSMACPAITGACALVRQYFADGFADDGKKGGRSHSASGSLIRAMIMNGGVDMTGLSGYPGNKEGWGRLLLDGVLWFRGETRKLLYADKRHAQGVGTGEEHVYKMYVTGNSEPLRITMTFADYPAQVNASYAPINDISLEVIDPDGILYYGNDIDKSVGLSKTGGSPDVKNSTEMVILNPPKTGMYIVKVKGVIINQGTKQGYAVVVTGDVTKPLMPGLGGWN